MSERVKVFGAGSVLTTMFIFFMTGIFTWMGNSTLHNEKEGVKLTSSLEHLNKSISSFNLAVEKLSVHIDIMDKQTLTNTLKLQEAIEDIKELKRSKVGL